MFYLRLLVVGALAGLLAWSAIRTLRAGRFNARGGKLITRDKNPTTFWLSVIVQCVVVAGLLVLLFRLVAT